MITKVFLYLKLNLNRNNIELNVLPAITIFIAVGITMAAYNSSDKILAELSNAFNVMTLLLLIRTLSISPRQ